MNLIQVDIAGFAFNPTTREPVMLLRRVSEPDPVKSLVPIAMGSVEAHSIISALQGNEHPRPMTHDLMHSVLQTIHAHVQEVSITRFEQGTFFASLSLAQNGVNFVIDARPSDAIALAVRAEAPVFIDENIFNETAVETSTIPLTPEDRDFAKPANFPPGAEQILSKIHNFANTVQPSDFRVES
jgi:bifunctional DNase/RNase